jgi:hypothetical protein
MFLFFKTPKECLMSDIYQKTLGRYRVPKKITLKIFLAAFFASLKILRQFGHNNYIFKSTYHKFMRELSQSITFIYEYTTSYPWMLSLQFP